MAEKETVPQEVRDSGIILPLDEIRARIAKLVLPEHREEADYLVMMAHNADPVCENVGNQKMFKYWLEKKIAKAKKTGSPICVLTLDLDNFKPYNETYGHEAGNEILRRVADVLRNRVKGRDFVARTGGDEFTILIEGTIVQTLVVGDRISRNIPDLTPQSKQEPDQPLPKLGVSIGIAQFDPTDPKEDAMTLFTRADVHGLLTAKKEPGKNAIGLVLTPNQKFSISDLQKLIQNDPAIYPPNKDPLANTLDRTTFIIQR